MVTNWLCWFAVMSSVTSDFIDACARELGAKRLRIQLPWEQSRFDSVMGSKQQSIVKPPEWIDFPLQLFDQSAAVSSPTRLNRFNSRVHLSEVSSVASEDRKLNLALQCWKVLVLDSIDNTDLEKLLMHCIEHGRSEDYIWQVVNDAFANKSTATLRSRAASLLAFGRWKRSAVGTSRGGIFLVTEEMAYDSLCDLRTMKATPSKGRRFLEALGFLKGLLGAPVDDTLKSSRVKGVAFGSSARSVKKKSPLTVQRLACLERLATCGSGQEAVFAGYICFLATLLCQKQDTNPAMPPLNTLCFAVCF